MKEKRGSWGSNFGFLMAAAGSAVGLGNLWGFPYKMGQSGGFAFLLVYLLLAALVGFPVILGELALGRKTGRGPVGAYRALSRGFSRAGWLSILAAVLFMGFYCVLGGWCLKYLVWSLGDALGAPFGSGGQGGSDLFWALAGDPGATLVYTGVYIAVNCVIVRLGVARGIERFSKIAMPALAGLLVLLVARCLTLPGAWAGMEFMFTPDLTPLRENPLGVLAAAGGQVFFSLSLGLGTMITYGSYLPKSAGLEKNAWSIVLADTAVALLAGLCVIPAAFSLGGDGASLGGPELLFVTLQDVFAQMGAAGAWFGVLFYALVALAAVTSTIALVEQLAACLREDVRPGMGRGKAVWIVGALCALSAAFVAADPVSRLEQMNRLSEGVLMPLSALVMALFLGYIYGEARLGEEVAACGRPFRSRRVFGFSCRVLVPLGILLVLAGVLGPWGG